MGPLELTAHLLVLLSCAGLLAWWGAQFSWQFEKGSKWDGYAPGLRQGLLLGRQVDLSDIQWREFRAGLPAMAALFLAAAAASRWLQRHRATPASRARGYLLLSLAILGYLHGACTVLVLAFVLVSFFTAQAAAGCRHGAVAIWVCNLGLLLVARLGGGFRFANLSTLLAPLDNHRGVMRWEICFNLCMLRMLSYALDLHWCRQQLKASSPTSFVMRRQQPPTGFAGVEFVGGKRSTVEGARWRQQTALPSEGDYGLLMYLAHVLYAPLYLAGPIITFQDFGWQLLQDAPASTRRIMRYTARFAADWLCLELLTHCLYFNSIAKHHIGLKYRRYGLQYGAIEMALTAFWVLCFMWLKFATIWRFFRLAALLDGIDPPENMRRCFANNYDIEGFWRGWHSSFNQWLVRYMYVPLGGSRQRALVIWPIFFFVAIWHDLEWRLFSWAWLVCLAFLPEMAVKRLAKSQSVKGWRHTALFRHGCAAGAALNIAALMAANLAGFVVGLDGLKGLLPEMLKNWRFVAATMTAFWSAANVQFWIREQEAKGKCL